MPFVEPAQGQATLSAPHVQPVHSQSKEHQPPAWLAVLTMRLIFIWMDQCASSAMLSVQPVVGLKTTTAILALRKRSLTRLPNRPNIALLLVDLVFTKMAQIADVSSIEAELACA